MHLLVHFYVLNQIYVIISIMTSLSNFFEVGVISFVIFSIWSKFMATSHLVLQFQQIMLKMGFTCGLEILYPGF